MRIHKGCGSCVVDRWLFNGFVQASIRSVLGCYYKFAYLVFGFLIFNSHL